MDLSAQFLLTIGGLLLLGMLTSFLATRTFLPRVTLLLIFGAIIGREILDIIPRVFSDNFEIISDMALLMVGFLLGGKLTRESWKTSGRQVLWISIVAALMTAIAVCVGLIWAGAPKGVAVLMGCIASATAPADDAVHRHQHDRIF
jgi:NhaP-type Na+/H+ or K+/H+ antiporter